MILSFKDIPCDICDAMISINIDAKNFKYKSALDIKVSVKHFGNDDHILEIKE